MNKSKNYSEKLQGFADRIKNDPVHLPVQKVNPVNKKLGNKDEQQLNVWIPKDLLKRLKMRGAETDTSLKDMVIQAINQFL